ncbi:MAG: LysR family transcriptional regulator [Caulobacteraceae bacterium]|nr:LysR family transcriptional regulator [Caulobacteraceae bacterium]
MSDSRLPEIDAFLCVARYGGFGVAARELGLSQSTVSRRIAQLEARLGTQLVARTTRDVSLTPAGAQFFQRARDAVALLNDAEASAAKGTGQGAVTGLVRMTGPTAFGRKVLAPAVGRLLDAHPALRIELELSDRYADLRTEPIDLAVRFSKEAPSGWACLPLGRIALRVCASPAYLARHGAPTVPDDLVQHRLVTARTYAARTDWPLRWDGQVKRVVIEPACVVSDFSALAEVVKANGGIAPLPAYLADEALADGSLVELEGMQAAATVEAVIFIPAHLRGVRRIDVVLEALQAQVSETIP